MRKEKKTILSLKSVYFPIRFRGTALSHHSAPYINPTASNLSSQDDPSTIIEHNDNDSSRTHRTNEIRRPRVSFSEFNKVQFFEDSNDNTQQSTHRQHHRHRSSKKSTAAVNNNQVSPPSIQHSQALYTPYRPLSRQQPVGHELNIRKQQLNPSPRVYSSRTTHLPDILNQSLSMENPNQDKYVLQREKSFFQFPEPAAEITVNSSAEISRENTRTGGTRSTAAVPDYYDQNDSSGITTLLNSSSIASSFANRQRPSFRTISLRQQFTTPLKAKPIHFSNNQTTNSRRAASLRHGIIRNQSIDDDHDDISNQPLENRPMTGINNSSKHLKRNYIIHFNPKNPFNGNSTVDSNEINRSSTKSNTHESSSQERFQNVLKIVRPPYIASIQNLHADSILHSTTNQMNGSHSSRNTSTHESHEYHLSSNTIFV